MIEARMSKPIRVTVRDDDSVIETAISELTFEELREGQSPPAESLVAECHRKLVDAGGTPIPAELLRSLDLEGGLRRAFRQALNPADLG